MKTAIFDFDQTLADTSELKPYRQARNWSYISSNLHVVKRYDKIEGIIAQLLEKEINIGIVTTSPSTYCKGILSHLNLGIVHVIGYHDARNRKPHPESILSMMKKLGGDPETTIGFGDDPNDIIAYQRAGISSVACLWGADSQQKLIETKPDHIINVPIEILEYF